MNPEAAEVPLNAMIAGVVVLGMLGLSLLMIGFWVARYLQFGYILPDAQRGYLRIPWPVTVGGIVIATFLAIIATTMSITASDEFAAAKGQSGVSDQTDQTDQTDQSDQSDQSDQTDQTDQTKTKQMTPEMMWGGMIQTLILDLFLFGLFGVMVLAFSLMGRVRRNTTLFPETTGRPELDSATMVSGSAAGSASSTGRANQPPVASLWPDLDDETANMSATSVRVSEADAMPVGSASGDPELFSAGVVEVEMVSPERFSFLTELRYAGEVFLASYLPTTMLRLAMIMIVTAVTGEQPDQHPFLEMIKNGLDWQLMAMIFVMAVIMAPIVEELFYRVVLLGGIVQFGSLKVAMLVSCILFSFAHGFPDSVALLPLAAALGYTYIRRQSYVTVMLVHFLFNGFNMILAGIGLL